LKLKELIDEFGKYQRSLTQIIAKKTEVETNKSTEIRNNIASANQEQLIKYKELIVSIDNVRAQVYKPINEFKEILDLYLNYNNKSAIVDDEKAPLLIVLKNEASENITINTNQLSSGEKQLLIIFLTVILQKDKPFILLMDEPETSLHVEWQSTLIDNIHRIRPNIQIIVATHNPLIALNRNQNEIGIIKHNEEEVVTDPSGTKYLDISSILLKYFELPSLIGKDMQKDINDFTCLKLKEQNEQLNATDSKELERISEILDNSFAGEIIYNTKYFSFLKFLKENKGIDFDKLEKIDEDEFQSFLNDFGGEFND
jgi:ABC-type Mn2+/Zn2+ transport system ATPase subunit